MMRILPTAVCLLLASGVLAACGDATPASTPQFVLPTDTPATGPTPTDTGIPLDTPTAVPVGPGQINASNLEQTIAQQYSGQAGGATAQVTCSQTGTFQAEPGDQVACQFTDSNGRSGTITVTVTGADGAYTWQVGAPTSSTAAPSPN